MSIETKHKPMKILLTGSGGFIGKNLKFFLSEKYLLLTPRSSELNLINENDVRNYFHINDIDFIIHCASTGGYRTEKDKDTTFEENIAMVNNILKFKKNSCRVILFGSGAMYDKSRPLHKVTENEIGKFIPKDLYGKSKLEISKMINKKDDVVCLNIFGCYGQYEKDSRFPTYAIKQKLKGEKISINQNVIFDYIYIKDLCKIIKYFISHKPHNKIINVTPDKSISLLEIANIINKIDNPQVDIKILTAGMNNEYTGSNLLLKSEMPNFQFTDYEKGLKELFNIIKSEEQNEKN